MSSPCLPRLISTASLYFTLKFDNDTFHLHPSPQIVTHNTQRIWESCTQDGRLGYACLVTPRKTSLTFHPGLALFQCDLDFDMVHDLNDEMGLTQQEKQAGKSSSTKLDGAHRRQAENAKVREEAPASSKFKQMPKPALQDPTEISYSLYAKLCSDPDKIRKHLDDTGVVSKFMRGYHSWMLDCLDGGLYEASFARDCYGPAYRYCLLGACVMTLGAKLSTHERKVMREYYKDAGFMRDGVKQLGEGLDGYKNGVPWEFVESKSLHDTMLAGGPKEEDLLFPGLGMMNTWWPDHGRRTQEMVRCMIPINHLNAVRLTSSSSTRRGIEPQSRPRSHA